MPSPLPPKLDVGAVNDPLEHEADHAAEQVMRMPHPEAVSATKTTSSPPEVQRQPAALPNSTAQSAPVTSGVAASPLVQEGVRLPGRPLDAATRAFFEPRFGYTFNHVRVHKDGRAAESAKAMRAEAYTLGQDIVLGPAKHESDTTEGRRLLAHELAHVVQQEKAQQDGTRRVPNSSATQIPATDAGGVSRSLTPVPHQLQRKPQSNWAGIFTEKDYYAISEPKGDPPGYGAHITLSFDPNESVDATQIAFVQTIQSLIRDSPGADPRVHKPFYVKDAKDEKVFQSRSLSDDEETLGTHIDQPTQERTPLYSMTRASDADIKSKKKNASPLAASVPAKYSDYGHRTSGEKPKPAIMTDHPGLEAKKDASAFGKFETTALAVEGAQQGTYYGTVKWGFTKEAGETKAELLPFELSPSASPSATFFEAAKAFGASKTSAGEQSLPLPISENRYVNNDTNLLSSPDKGKVSSKLSLNTPVEILDDSSKKGWVKVIVTGGDHKAAMGWLKSSELSTSTTQKIVPKKHR